MSQNVAELVRALREAIGITQEELGRRAGYAGSPRVYVAKLETGHNKLTTSYGRASLARGFGLQPQQLDEYLEGRASLSVTLERIRGETFEHEAAHELAADPAPLAEDASAFDAALLWSLDKERHGVADFDAVRSALRNTAQMRDADTDLVAAARIWLDAAARLRRAGKPVTLETLLLAVTVGDKTSAVSPTAKALQSATQQEWNDAAKKKT